MGPFGAPFFLVINTNMKKENRSTEKYYNQARYLIKHQFPVPTQNVDALVQLIMKKEDKEAKPPATNSIPDLSLPKEK